MKKLLNYLLVFVFLFTLVSVHSEAVTKEKYASWQAVAEAMHKNFQEAKENVAKNDYNAAFNDINNAYFGKYEVQGFEKNVMVSIATKRVNEIEGQFRQIKQMLKGHVKSTPEQIDQKIDNLDMKVFKDAMVLDGVAKADDPDTVGKIVFKNQKISTNTEELKLQSFFTSFGLLLREGLEAILVIVAIIAYLVKTNNKQLCKQVYAGMGLGVLCSFLLAYLIDVFLGGIGQELMEGITMFLAVIVLFWVSNWILARSEAAAWQEYIHEQVQKSIDKNSGRVLVFSAFLAVVREGAELVLFYKAALTGGQTDKMYAIYGFIAGAIVLVIIFLIFRFTTVKLPLRPFFMFTSIFLFLLCVSFMGKGVLELGDANVIIGSTNIPAMHGFEFQWLNIYPRAETLIPQIMLVIAFIWILINHKLGLRKEEKNDKK